MTTGHRRHHRGYWLEHPLRVRAAGGRLLVQGTQLPFTSTPTKFAALAVHDGLVAMNSDLDALAVALLKIINDICWLTSGQRSRLGEIGLPEIEPGS